MLYKLLQVNLHLDQVICNKLHITINYKQVYLRLSYITISLPVLGCLLEGTIISYNNIL